MTNGAASPTSPRAPQLLRIYLQDHYAAASGATALARRAATSQRHTVAGSELAVLALQIAEDRSGLLEVMHDLGVRPHRAKTAAALGAERVGRFKPNGSAVRRSPLSDVVEIEALTVAVRVTEAGWRTLLRLAVVDDRLDPQRLDALRARAELQSRTLGDLHQQAVARAFSTRT